MFSFLLKYSFINPSLILFLDFINNFIKKIFLGYVDEKTHFQFVKFGKGKYFCINYSGPIRNAGGTAAAVSVLIADYLRKKMGYSEYDPDEKEKARVFCEIEHYNDRCVRLQYLPSKEEVNFIMENIPVGVSNGWAAVEIL